MDDTDKIYVRERFDGIEDVYKGKRIIDVPALPENEYGAIICPNCGQQKYGYFDIRNESKMRVTSVNGELLFEIIESQDDLMPIGEFAMIGSEEDSDMLVAADLFEDHFQHGNTPRCLNCGYNMVMTGWCCDDGCPGCYICGNALSKKEVKLYCLKTLLDEKCDPWIEGCYGCPGHYSRVKNKVSLEELWKLHRQI